MHDTYSVEKEPEKKENKLEEGEINSETEMDEISEGNKVSQVEIDEEVKEKKTRRYKWKEVKPRHIFC